MVKRNFSMIEYWKKIIDEWEPELSFKGSARAEWEEWKDKAHTVFMELLGSFPEEVPLEAETESSVVDGDLIRERVVFNSETHMSVPCQVLRPAHMKEDGSNPAILCSHGHGPYGKDPVAGIRAFPEIVENIKHHNYDYGMQMAKAGFLTICPDLRVFGERSDEPAGATPYPGRDKCNINYVKGTLLGMYTLTLNIWDMKCCIDYLETRPEVDPGRIGMMGLSQGGTMTTFTTAAEPRIKAADIMGYVNPWTEFAFKKGNCCGSQVIPGMLKYLDVPDIAGLIAPRPLLLEMGIYDQCFPIHNMLKGAEKVKEIYKAAGSEDDLWFDIFPKGHAFGGGKAFDFFKKYL